MLAVAGLDISVVSLTPLYVSFMRIACSFIHSLILFNSGTRPTRTHKHT